MAGVAGNNSVRLASLLRRFGLAPMEFVKQETRPAVQSLRSSYHRLAQEQHPDKAPEAKRDEAAERFKQLNMDYDEAVKLLEAGVRPAFGTPVAGAARINLHTQMGTPGSGGAAAYMYGPQPWNPNGRPSSEPAQFDLKTRVKGNLIFWTGFVSFLFLAREFLVWSAGSCFAWSRPADWNPFWIRRFQDEWADEERKHRKKVEDEGGVGAAVKRKMSIEPERKDRGVDPFYQKRGISNVRREHHPRGWG
eukprot:TRINITY_DN14237_c0_g1_i1.p1 TRINITY_DN14237_c0_g1~~TRINITY_DN14237_c0_g1_i1.p1  ORF type:complete len:249 (-),score=49.87 TRINITY_DN14237_c0_g1_i1:79-825(-)